jgi:hypothetical protein
MWIVSEGPGEVRSTPARLLRQDQLLVERDAVHKITKVDHAIPHNTVIAEVTNQVTGEESTRTLRWDQHVTTEEPLEVAIGETGKITVELALQRDVEDRPLYRYKITDEAAGIDHEATDLHLGPRLRPDNIRAAKTLLSFLYAANEAYLTELEGNIDSENLELFPMSVNEWAYVHAEDIEMAQVELIRGLER